MEVKDWTKRAAKLDVLERKLIIRKADRLGVVKWEAVDAVAVKSQTPEVGKLKVRTPKTVQLFSVNSELLSDTVWLAVLPSHVGKLNVPMSNFATSKALKLNG